MRGGHARRKSRGRKKKPPCRGAQAGRKDGETNPGAEKDALPSPAHGPTGRRKARGAKGSRGGGDAGAGCSRAKGQKPGRRGKAGKKARKKRRERGEARLVSTQKPFT